MPETPAVTLRAADQADVDEYLASARETYIAERIRAGDHPDAAAASADDSLGRAFPGGLVAGGHLVFRVEAGGRKAGTLWIGPLPTGPEDRWWMWNITIDEAYRGRGVGRQTMLLAEAEARARGVTELGLNVFGHNHVAIGLYRSLGYEVAAMQMRKPL